MSPACSCCASRKAAYARSVRRYFEINNKVMIEAAGLAFFMEGGEIYANTYIETIDATFH